MSGNIQTESQACKPQRLKSLLRFVRENAPGAAISWCESTVLNPAAPSLTQVARELIRPIVG